MKLKEYLDKLNYLVANDKSLLELEVITSIDDEGNGYNPVYFDASVGVFEDDEFIEEDDCTVPNAICVN